MPITTDDTADNGDAGGHGAGGRSAAWKRLAWFAGLWLAGVASVTPVSLALRWALHSG